MKLVEDINVKGITPKAGCKCSGSKNHAKTKGWFHPIISCKCQCSHGATNRAYNKGDARDA